MRGLLRLAFRFIFACAASPDPASAEPLTASRVVALARAQSPEAQLAATRVAEARGGLAGARTFALDNPTIEGTQGHGDQGTISNVELTVPLGFGMRRARQITEAKAGLAREQFLETDAALRTVGEALGAFYAVLHAERRASIATERRDLANELLRIASDRFQAGDAARLEVVAAEAELSRAESEILAEEHDIIHARTHLARVLGLTSGTAIEISGDLGDRSLLEDALGAPPSPRADVRAAESQLESATAAAAVARTARLPDVAFRLNYERTEDEDIASPGLALSIPLFNRGQGDQAEAEARVNRAAIELETRRRAVAVEEEGARSAYERMRAAASEIEERALPRALELEDLARQSYSAGKLDLPALLVVRGGALDARREHADRLLQAALSGIDLTLAVGAMPQ